MNLKEIASISGKSGLFKIVKPTRAGVIVESIDEKKARFVASANNRVSILSEISVYTTDKEGSVQLEQVMKKIYDEFKDDPGVNASSDNSELKSFFKHILPEYDEDKVYVSDMKKIVAWYNILNKNMPEVFTAVEESNNETPEKEPVAEETESKEKSEKKEKKGRK